MDVSYFLQQTAATMAHESVDPSVSEEKSLEAFIRERYSDDDGENNLIRK